VTKTSPALTIESLGFAKLAITVGVAGVPIVSAFRSYGLVFNDHGVLRMDCAQVNGGGSLD